MSKKILIFDMDGVLLKPRGYHQALKDTVRIAGRELGFENINISDAEIAEFESLGISSEWHSGAACMATLSVYKKFALRPLFRFLKREQAQLPARIRLERAVGKMAESEKVDSTRAVSIIQKSETLQSSTYRIFQEMILGSEEFLRIYGLKNSLDVESYLFQFDEPLLGSDVIKKLFAWLQHTEHGGVVMTNRPSRHEPDARYGKKLVGIDAMPLVGYGEMSWLAKKFGGEAAEYSKPSPIHALTASLTAFGRGWERSLVDAYAATNRGVTESIACLDGSEIWVFEDSPAGIVSVGAMGELLNNYGISVKINKVGIATSAYKDEALRAQGAQIFKEIGSALMDVL